MSFIKIHRELMDSYAFANPKHLKIWLWLLMKANYKKAFVPISTGRGEMTVEVKRGQLIFGRFKAENELDMESTFIRRTLQKFKELGQIKMDVHSHFTIITICKYDTYQSQENESAQALPKQYPSNAHHVPNTCPTDAQHVPTSKEELEELEIKEEKEVLEVASTQNLTFTGIYPKNTDFTELPGKYIESVKMQTFQTKKITLESSTIIDLWEAFKLQNLDGVKLYQNENDVYKHFVNWFKSQKFENNGTKSKSRAERHSEGLHYLLNLGKTELAKVMAINQQNKTD